MCFPWQNQPNCPLLQPRSQTWLNLSAASQAHATEADEPLYTRTVAWTVHAADELAASTVPVYRHL